MSFNNFPCDSCDAAFSSSKALKIHHTKVHAKKQTYSCSFCNYVFTKLYNLERHHVKCVSKTQQVLSQQVLSQQVAEAKEEASKIKTELMVTKVECQFQKKVADFFQQQLETAKAPTTINNITHNINNVYNNNRSYTQQNNFLGDNFEKLIPITEKSLKENFKQVFDEARMNKHYLTSEKEIGFKLTSGPLKESLICTDASRGIVHWKDGDNDNKHVKDPLCLSLSNKMFHVMTNNYDVVDDYKNFLNEKQDSFNINTMPKEAMDCCDSTDMIKQLSKSDTITKIGKIMSKSVPSELTFVKKEYKLEKLYSLLEKLVYKKPYEVLLQSASAIANWFLKALQSYGFVKNKKSEELLSIVDDDDKTLSLTQKDIFNILRTTFERIDRYDVVAKVSLESYFDTFSNKVESFEDAENNFKKLDLWIKEENVETFERSFYHFFEILLK